MEFRRTTGCCRALALVLVSTVAVCGQSSDERAIRLLPLRPAWNLPLHNVLTAQPALSGTLGYFPIEGGRLAAYDLEYGTLLWLAEAHAVSQPAVGDGLVFVIEPETLTALSGQTGTIVWQLPLMEALAVPLVWDNGWLIGATSSGIVLAYRARDGGLIWRRETGSSLLVRPALAADRVYLPADHGRVIALRVDTGEPIWERRIGGRPNDILAIDDHLYVGSTDNYFYCIDAATGEIAWRWTTGADVVGLPIVDEHRVYFVSLDNVLRALDRNTGAQRWKRPLPIRPTRGPVRAGDTLIVSGISPTAPAYMLKDGRPAGEIAGGGELAAAPHVVAGANLTMLALVTQDLVEGTIVRAMTRSFEPAMAPIAPLPNPVVPLPPGTPPTDSPR